MVLAWKSCVTFSGISPITLPAPSRVIAQTIEHRSALLENTIPTLNATLLGFVCSLAAAFVFSVPIDFFRPLRRTLIPVFVISQTVPLVAIASLIVLWFGFGLTPKVILEALVTFFLLTDIRKSFDEMDVFGGISLQVKRGEFVSILSPSGMGKSTPFRLL
ncbi:MAG: hypothetical protein MO846_10535, partial [Candidatus Devosia symbiotica]|nr:hypothetical protein [Candidatus Devosia symbiotica]